MKKNLYITCIVTDSVEFEYEGEMLSLSPDCFTTIIPEENENAYLEVEFVEGFTEEMLDAILDDKRYEYSKGQLASKETWQDIKRAWMSEINEKN